MKQAKQIINLLHLDNFYPAISLSSKRKRRIIVLRFGRSLWHAISYQRKLKNLNILAVIALLHLIETQTKCKVNASFIVFARQNLNDKLRATCDSLAWNFRKQRLLKSESANISAEKLNFGRGKKRRYLPVDLTYSTYPRCIFQSSPGAG